MNTGYVENGFIVDLSNARKTSEIIYELSRVLDIEEAKNKQICLKLGEVELNQTELTSIKALVESMDSEIEFISTSNSIDIDSYSNRINNIVTNRRIFFFIFSSVILK